MNDMQSEEVSTEQEDGTVSTYSVLVPKVSGVTRWPQAMPGVTYVTPEDEKESPDEVHT